MELKVFCVVEVLIQIRCKRCVDKVDKYELKDEHHGDADAELQVLGLMSEQLHTQPCTDTSTNSRDNQESRFRYSPFLMYSPPFVYTIKY